MNLYIRNGKRWNVNELLTLQREYELLELNIEQIAENHQRTIESILYKLENEGFITTWNSARGFDLNKYNLIHQQNKKSLIKKTNDDDNNSIKFDENFPKIYNKKFRACKKIII